MSFLLSFLPLLLHICQISIPCLFGCVIYSFSVTVQVTLSRHPFILMTRIFYFFPIFPPSLNLINAIVKCGTCFTSSLCVLYHTESVCVNKRRKDEERESERKWNEQLGEETRSEIKEQFSLQPKLLSISIIITVLCFVLCQHNSYSLAPHTLVSLSLSLSTLS